MARKQITQFTAASAIALTDRFLLQQGATGTAFTYGTVTQLLNGGLASTYSSVTVNGSTVPANGIYLPASNTLGFAVNTTAEMQMTGTALSPATSDGLALGTTALMWSDLFLASGAVLNFNNGDVTLTHSADTLTMAGGAFVVSSTATANSFIPSSSTAPTNGMFLPTTNALGWSSNSAEKMRLDADGDLGIGTTGPTARIHAVRDSTDSSGASIVALFDGAQSVAHSGSYSVNYVKGTYSATSGTLATFSGVFSQPMVTGAGTVTSFSGMRSVPQNTSTGTVTDMYGVYTRYDNSNAGGTLTNAYGVYIATSTNSGTITNRWGLYQQDPSAKNVLIGRTLIASATDDGSTAFQVNGNAKATGYFLRSVGDALTATGTTRADALQLAKEVNRLTTAAAGTGVILPVGVVGMRIRIYQSGANPVKVYASASETIDGVAGATGVTLTNALRCEYEFVAANTWISAQLGVVSA